MAEKPAGRHLQPVLHMVRTLPGMIVETFRTPAHYRIQENDWMRLLEQFPKLSHFREMSASVEGQLRPAYRDYTRSISSPLISLSLNRAVFVSVFARITQAKRILDLGSGFSTYVFGEYALQSGANVLSVDHAPEWMAKTRAFLHARNLTSVQYQTIDQLIKEADARKQMEFDLCLLDIGDFELRMQLLPGLVESAVLQKAIILIDDYHVSNYRRAIQTICDRDDVQLLSLRKYTRRRLSHMALVVAR